MSRKSMKEKIETRFKQIQIDRNYEEKSLRFDSRREAYHDATRENAEIEEN